MARALNHILQRRHLITHMSSALYCFSIGPCTRHGARYSTKKSVSKVDSNETNNQVQVGTAEVVKENLKSAGYLGVIVGGIGVTALIIYTLCSELFSSSSPYAVYSEARVRCMEHPKVMDVLGAPVKAFGEETRRGRRRHITHLYYVKDGVKYMRLRFYVQGTRRQGTVYAEVKENASGGYEYSYLYVTVNHVGTIVVEDNQDTSKTHQANGSTMDFNLLLDNH
ncbi:PREDICTED: mitochondrial import inner membrane translocase subunit Tim21 [Vollenhovia emeryi]|uniref:mitochondrial import inner membrane translocase subunit Tim21 n=1 Tax=Vollenhovia emeryi TaxID=411798 RepID=UPI0005F4C9E0|nr:PREDICTED: mitochondrial import inner membrane translocase subunit Tim21 [Vollenhovia emeryi]XP_011863640.1 PREDICTED: mitochondrial import inner membrane translocase subunit Tim21 [Vollenhovia emeryi]XP_011863641.1 PREDICTED: mitochondrial import inner membrane translocase subunit Tim21 [Vollenhovia emeryi]XP_011863642.1 PREDICTED: mitochondrial import inner membrane translocase subunit Tim21 [Vollenhovia emeryi]